MHTKANDDSSNCDKRPLFIDVTDKFNIRVVEWDTSNLSWREFL